MVLVGRRDAGVHGAVLRVAINGFGRIGRMVCRRLLQSPLLQVVAVNASYDSQILAHLLRRDSLHGVLDRTVEAGEDALWVDGQEIRLTHERDPARLPWAEIGVDLVIEATGKFRGGEGAQAHLDAGAGRVIVTAPAKGHVDATIVYGVNHHTFDPERHRLISAASCTTTCLAPIVKVLHEAFHLETGLMTTVHSYTSDQNLLDNPHKDLRRARGAGFNIIPTTTGAAKAVGLVVPEVAGRLTGYALRVPTPDVSVVDLTARFREPVTVESVNRVLREAAEGELKGILGYSEEPLVSSDYVGDSRSGIVDGLSTLVGRDNLVKVVAWYDNEWGYSCRVADLAEHMARTLLRAAEEETPVAAG